MNSIEFQTNIIEFIEENLELPVMVRGVPLSIEKKGISVLTAPSHAKNRYYDGGLIDAVSVQILAKSENAPEAEEWVSAIAYLLESVRRAEVSGSDFIVDYAEIAANPCFADMDETGAYVFNANVIIYYERYL